MPPIMVVCESAPIRLSGNISSFSITATEDTVEIDLSKIKSAVAGPKNPDELINIEDLKGKIEDLLKEGNDGKLVKNGAVVLSAITSCTNTSDPFVLLGAGLIAKKAIDKLIRVFRPCNCTFDFRKVNFNSFRVFFWPIIE